MSCYNSWVSKLHIFINKIMTFMLNMTLWSNMRYILFYLIFHCFPYFNPKQPPPLLYFLPWHSSHLKLFLLFRNSNNNNNSNSKEFLQKINRFKCIGYGLFPTFVFDIFDIFLISEPRKNWKINKYWKPFP